MTQELSLEFRPNTKLHDLYLQWIKQFDARYAKAWKDRFNNDAEAAMCEATYWKVLEDCGVSVEPADNITSNQPSPDFRCSKNGEHFYVEVTCLQRKRVVKNTSLLLESVQGVQAFRNLNSAMFKEVVRKTPQCANLNAPALVAIGTFHSHASGVCVQKRFIEEMLTGETMISRQFDTRSLSPVGDSFLSTELKSATCLKPGSDSYFEPAREPVSGILVGGFGCLPHQIYGLLHPYAVRPFNPQLLDGIPFCRLPVDDTRKTLKPEWIQ